MQGASGKPLLVALNNNFAEKSSLWQGLTRRLRRGRRACSPMGARLLQGANRRFPKGNEGKRVSSGYNRRRRLATRSSGKQQAERTAVRAAPIVCPEESPLMRPQAQSPAPLVRRLPEGGAGGRAESHPACINQRQLCRKQFPLVGLDAPTPAREKGL